MLETLKKEREAKLAITLFVILTVWWFISPSIQGHPPKRFFGDFPSIYAVMALLGGVWGFNSAKKWGGIKSVMGRGLMLFSLGLFAQVFGQVTYAYFSFYQHIAVPYPSLGDVGYFGSIPLYIGGIVMFAKASGVRVSLRSFKSKLQAVIIPVVILGIGYYLFLQGYKFAWNDPIKIFLDFGYPMGQAIYISLAILTFLLSKGILGGIMKSKIIFILFALCVQFASDYTFLYQSSKNTWVVGGINDYMYLFAYLTMSIGLLQFKTVFNKLKG